jgi:lipopolysaccharide/colanic/teichoic acid biosynthesis glycosyltransferase
MSSVPEWPLSDARPRSAGRARGSVAAAAGGFAAAALAAGALVLALSESDAAPALLAALAVAAVGALGAVAARPAPGRRGPFSGARPAAAWLLPVLTGTVLLAILGEAVLDGLGAWEALLVAALALAAGRAAASAIEGALSSPRRVVLVGTGEVAIHLARAFGGRRRDAQLVAIVDDEDALRDAERAGNGTVGNLADLPRIVRERRADLVVFSFVVSGDPALSERVRACRAAGADVAVVSRLFQGLPGALSIRRVEGLPMIVAGARPGRLDAVATRATDIALALLVIVLSAPIWLALAVAIRLDSPGPVLYKARRVGRGGAEFDMLKFRKMAEDAAGPALTAAEDERFTRMGRFLARSKLDELPQVLNVLRGEMGFVGPRPEDARYVAAQRETFAHVLSVRPGITGLSQIRYRREFEHLVGDDFESYYLQTLLPTKLAIDRYYVDHRSWALDMRILLWTAVALVRGGELHVSELASHVSFRQAAAEDPLPPAGGGPEHPHGP